MCGRFPLYNVNITINVINKVSTYQLILYAIPRRQSHLSTATVGSREYLPRKESVLFVVFHFHQRHLDPETHTVPILRKNILV